MNKVELIDEITKKTGLTKKDTDATLKAFIEAVTEALAKGDSVQLVGFGTFDVGTRGERTGRNPKTGVEAVISSRRVISFKPSQMMRKLINR